MTKLVESVRRRRMRNLDHQLQHFLRDREVTQIEVTPDLNCEGSIEPLGRCFSDGFCMRLKRNTSEARVRFTLAHEVCHTFFYELVPEIKFYPHEQDSEEERLCNVGAATLLVPASSLLRKVKGLPASLESLELLASQFAVSLPTMALRLRSLGCWNCQLSFWHRMVNGNFALDRLYGGKQARWQWDYESVLREAWESTKPLFGRTFVHYENDRGHSAYKLISYQLRRTSDGVMVLWGTRIRKPSSEPFPLFTKHGPVL